MGLIIDNLKADQRQFVQSRFSPQQEAIIYIVKQSSDVGRSVNVRKINRETTKRLVWVSGNELCVSHERLQQWREWGRGGVVVGGMGYPAV